MKFKVGDQVAVVERVERWGCILEKYVIYVVDDVDEAHVLVSRRDGGSGPNESWWTESRFRPLIYSKFRKL